MAAEANNRSRRTTKNRWKDSYDLGISGLVNFKLQQCRWFSVVQAFRTELPPGQLLSGIHPIPTMVTLGNLRDKNTLLAIFGLMFIAALLAWRVRAAMLIGILATTLVGVWAGDLVAGHVSHL